MALKGSLVGQVDVTFNNTHPYVFIMYQSANAIKSHTTKRPTPVMFSILKVYQCSTTK